ncbi:taste receptor type 2 member 140-like [Anomaloglossus baeobatrachus]|uniref:taste receptor type 2 member 140-like n=1 Tax=Anomaloglossus baeobatrachus TaxID=238106 RepID=UPI003F4F95D4
MPFLEILHILITIVMLIPGTALNSFIASMYVTHSRKKQRLTTCEQIVLSTALTDLVLQWFSVFINLMFSVFSRLPHIGIIYLYLSVFFFCMSYFFFWNTAWLSIQYCLKLSNFSTPLTNWVKVQFSSSITQIISASLIWVFVVSFPVCCTVTLVIDSTTNSTSPEVNYYCLTLNILLGCVLPFISTLVCIGLSVIYLIRHVWRIKTSESNVSYSPRVSGHVRAIRSMVLQVILNTVLQMAITGNIASSFNLALFRPKDIFSVLFKLTILTYPSVEALTLILGNPTLKKRFLQKLAVLS